MRQIGLVMVAVGALVLGAHVFGLAGRAEAGGVAPAGGPARAGWASPVVAGIALVGGLLLLVSDRREPAD